jgi:translation initiation factor IF-2
MLAGKHHGKIKAMYDERGNIVNVAGPSTGIGARSCAATAGDKFNVFEDEKKQNKLRLSVLN